MSQTTIAQCANDPDFQKRVQSAVYSEAFTNESIKDTLFAQQVRQGYANLTASYWGVAVAVESQYEAGVNDGRGSPGHDGDVIADADILAAVQAGWPPELPPTAGPLVAPAIPPPVS